MACSEELDYPYEGSDEASESELLERSLSVWSGLSNYGGNDFTPVALDLHTASSIGHYDCVRNIIEKHEEDFDRKNHGGWTALMYASYIGYDTVVHLLLEAGVSVSVKNNKGQTSLMLAASCGNESVAYFLLQQGADIESRDNRGWTALFYATFSGHQNMVKFLLDNDANINAVEPLREMTPFMEAAAAGHEIILQNFLHHDVNLNMKNCSGDTARSLALMKGHRKIVSLIDNHVVGPFLPMRTSDTGSSCAQDYLSSSDEAFPNSMKRPNSRKAKPRTKGGASIRDGPEAFEVLIDRANVTPGRHKAPAPVTRPTHNRIIPQGYVTFANSVPDTDSVKNIRYRDVTSPINVDDHKLDLSGGKDSLDNNNEDCGNVFSQTGALTIRSSSSSSSGLAVALKQCHRENSSADVAQISDVDVSDDDRYSTFSRSEVPAPEVPPGQPGSFHGQPTLSWGEVGGRCHVETDCPPNNNNNNNNVATTTTSLGVDRDMLVSLEPSTLTSRAYIEQRQMLQQRPHDLAELLEQLNLSKYLAVFDEQDVDLQVFLTLTDNDLHKIGIMLFGPRKKMNVAIARWHSNARPSGNDLEQAYADKLETEMQEMAIQLLQANNQLERMRGQLLQEKELRSVTEACLMEDHATTRRIYQLSADNLQRCLAIREQLSNIRRYADDLTRRSCRADESSVVDGTSSSSDGDVVRLSDEHHVARKLEETIHNLALVLHNTETVLKEQFRTSIVPKFGNAPPR